MIKNYVLFLLILIAVSPLHAQLKPYYKTYDWEESPKYEVKEDDSTQMVVLKKKIVREYFFESSNQLSEYRLEHRIMWLNSDREIEKNNKVYVPYSEFTEIMVTKGRVIKKNGEIVELDESQILQAEDEESGQKYKYFTFEGIEKGSIIEYMFVTRKNPSLSQRIDIQSYYPIYDFSFELYGPTNLVFAFKSYNGLPEVERDTTYEDKFRWSVEKDTISALAMEDQAFYAKDKQYLIFKLDKNLATRAYDLSNYGNNAENVYKYVYINTTKKEQKDVLKLLKSIRVDAKADEAKRIRSVEDYIKSKIFLIENYSEQFSDLSFIIENNMSNENGFLKLYAQIFKSLNIDCQMVLTCDRSEMEFDQDFSSSIFLDEYLIYFPSIDMYMSPTALESRLGFPPALLTSNYGLFIKEVNMGDFNTGVGKVRFINPVDYTKTADTILVNLTFNNEDPTTTDMNVIRSTSGYYAMFLQPILHLVEESDKEEILDDQIKYLNENIELTDRKVFNDNAEAFGVAPLRVEANVKTDVFVAKAGPKYLFKVGELIGPQMEMYQEKSRVLPVETDFKRNYHREIVFTIPDGYQIANLDDLKIDNEEVRNGDVLFKFLSTYTQDGNTVTVMVDEYYTVLEVAPELYQSYRKIINSAADFNKITLIMEKLN